MADYGTSPPERNETNRPSLLNAEASAVRLPQPFPLPVLSAQWKNLRRPPLSLSRSEEPSPTETRDRETTPPSWTGPPNHASSSSSSSTLLTDDAMLFSPAPTVAALALVLTLSASSAAAQAQAQSKWVPCQVGSTHLCDSDDRCISSSRVCDDTPDCSDGSDEEGCQEAPFECKGEHMFKCKSEYN